ncbi:MAG: 3-oxo-5-alpha-steroid 4-dehydrogenase [Alphaproteobacteria bacterium]
MPLVVALLAFIFNVFNASFHGYWFFFMDNQYEVSWLLSSNFLLGLSIFILGMAINIHSDKILLRISKEKKGYKIPYGGFYKWITSPNYLGEIIEWIGWAIMTWSLSGFVFALWTTFNLLPRALKHHSWYKDKFDNYPKDRKAIIPKIL